MNKRVKLERTIGGLSFVAELPGTQTTPPGVEARYLVAMERWIMEKLCEVGSPTSDGFQFLRQHMRLKAKDLAVLLDVVPETISRWENGGDEKNRVPGPAWEVLVSLAEDYLQKRSDTLTRLRERHERRVRSRERSSVLTFRMPEAAPR